MELASGVLKRVYVLKAAIENAIALKGVRRPPASVRPPLGVQTEGRTVEGWTVELLDASGNPVATLSWFDPNKPGFPPKVWLETRLPIRVTGERAVPGRD